MHRPIDIQTSDAGPGVSSHERITQLRLAESFMINGLDLQSRFHYAPGSILSFLISGIEVKSNIKKHSSSFSASSL